MQMTTEARTWLDVTVRRILARFPLGDAERAGLTYELMSHLHAAGEERASAAGRAEVSRADLEAAHAKAGGDDGLAHAFVAPLAKPFERVLFGRRAAALAIDVLVIGIGLSFVHNLVTALATPLFSDRPGMGDDESLWGLFPWGFHDPTLPAAVQALIAVASAVLVMGYFTWTEGHDGRSLGKRALALRVMRTDGKPVTYREAFLRNLVKLQPFVFILDTLIMLLFFRAEKQRVSDRIAETIVVKV
ncbi:MAG: RDD family protein [Methanobacteriota archaeon]